MTRIPLQTDFISFPSGMWFSPFGQSNTTATPIVGELYLSPFVLPQDLPVQAISLQLSAATSNDAALRMCVYDNVVNNWLPNSPKIDATIAAGSALNGAQVVSGLSVTIKSGIVWIGYVFTAGTTLTNVVQCGYGGAGGFKTFPVWYGSGATPNIANGNDGTVARQTGVTGVAPNPFTGALRTDSSGPSRPPTIMLRVT
jgi:hypothetical protein